MKKWIVVKSTSRQYGYSIKDTSGKTTWAKNPGCSCGWYKYKKDAQHAADVQNYVAVTLNILGHKGGTK